MKNKRYKIYEISDLVGYSNSDYFYKNFRLYEGMSPKEFQMQNNLGSNDNEINYRSTDIYYYEVCILLPCYQFLFCTM